MTISEEFSKQNTAEVFYPVILGELRNQGWCIFLTEEQMRSKRTPGSSKSKGNRSFLCLKLFSSKIASHPQLSRIQNWFLTLASFHLERTFSCRPVGHLWVPEFFSAYGGPKIQHWVSPSETNKLYRTAKKKQDSHSATNNHTIYCWFPWKKHPSHPSQPTRRRFSCTPSAMSTRSPVASWISRESRRVTYGGGTSFEVIRGRLTTKATPHTHTHVRKAPKHFIGEKSRKKWRWASLFVFAVFFGGGWLVVEYDHFLCRV